MISFTVSCLCEPVLLFDQAGPRVRCIGRSAVIPGPAEQRDCPECVKLAKFVTLDPFELLARCLPGFDPALGQSDLILAPVRQARRRAFSRIPHQLCLSECCNCNHTIALPDAGPLGALSQAVV